MNQRDRIAMKLSENIEDRRREKFGSFPQAPQLPNVFADDALLTGLGRDDFTPIQDTPLSAQAGAPDLQAMIDQYLAMRASR
jgi:hypothetical protein